MMSTMMMMKTLKKRKTEEVEIPPEVELDPKLAAAFKEKVKDAKSKQLDEFANNVEDNVRLHEKGWKVSKVSCYSCRCWVAFETIHLLFVLRHFVRIRIDIIGTSARLMTCLLMGDGNTCIGKWSFQCRDIRLILYADSHSCSTSFIITDLTSLVCAG